MRAISPTTTGATAPFVNAARLWFGFFSGPVAWTLRLLVSYPLVPLACRLGTDVPLHVVTGVFALVAAAGAIVSWHICVATQEAPPGEAGTPLRRTHFMAVSGFLLNVIFLLAILVEGASPLLVDPCIIPRVDPPYALLRASPVVALVFEPAVAWAAHGPATPTASFGDGWSPAAWLAGSVALAAGLYVRGVREVWRRAGAGRVVRRRQAVAYGAALVALAVALLSPLDALSAELFSAHMVQHLVLVVVAAPLFVLAEPLVPLLWALPRATRRALARGWRRRRWLAGAWRGLTAPLVVVGLHGVAVGLWHVPWLYEAALASEALHIAEHVSFVATALLFWWGLLHAGRAGGPGYGVALLAIFGTSLLMTALGALLTFAPAPWYPAHAGGAAAWGLTALEDQQLAGLLMWVPAGLVYAGVAGALFVAWLREAGRRVSRRERAAWSSPSGPAEHDRLPSGIDRR